MRLTLPSIRTKFWNRCLGGQVNSLWATLPHFHGTHVMFAQWVPRIREITFVTDVRVKPETFVEIRETGVFLISPESVKWALSQAKKIGYTRHVRPSRQVARRTMLVFNKMHARWAVSQAQQEQMAELPAPVVEPVKPILKTPSSPFYPRQTSVSRLWSAQLNLKESNKNENKDLVRIGRKLNFLDSEVAGSQ